MRDFFITRIQSIREHYNIKLRFVLFACISVFLLSVFDSIMSYIVPNVMTDSGLSDVAMGVLYASSSFFGFILDFILAKYLTTTHYKKTLLYTTVIGILFPILMLTKESVILYILAMFVWGLYYNLWGFATSDFTARESKVAFHVASASMIMLFHDIGYLTGTLSAEPLIGYFKYSQLTYILIAFLVLSTLLQIPNLILGKKMNPTHDFVIHKHGVKEEFRRLRAVAVILMPLLVFGTVRTVLDAITWTVTPIIDKVAPNLQNLGGVILAVNFLPSLIAYSFAASLTVKFGKKRTAVFSFILGCLILALLGVTTSAVQYLIVTFISSFFLSISYAATGGAYADYLRESKSFDNEIMSSSDMAVNLGYVIGPIIGGVLLAVVNSTMLFTYAGLGGVVIGLIVMKFMPKHIPFFDKSVMAKEESSVASQA